MPVTQRLQYITPHWILWIVLVLAVLWFAALGSRRLLDPDEGRYAEIAREMLVTGDWVTPRLNGLKYFEKPPLQYWATASAYRVFGQNEFAARFWTGLCGFAGVLLVGFAGTRLFGRDAGWMAACVLASSLLYVVVGQINTLDMGLSFFLELALVSFLLAQQTTRHSRAEQAWMLLAWAAIALAFLSKGLVAVILPGLTLVLYSLVTRDRSPWRRLHPLTGLPVFLLLAGPWIVAVSRANPEFLSFFFLREQFERFFTTLHDRDGPWWYFVALLALGALPWTTLLPQTLKESWRADGAGFASRRFLMLYAAVVIVFFSVSRSKLPPYIAPIFPALALVLGDAFTRMKNARLQHHLLVVASVVFVLGIVVVLVPESIAGPRSVDVVKDLRPETASALLLSAYAMFAAAWLLRKYAIDLAVTVAGIGTFLGLCLLVHGSDGLRATRSGHEFAAQLAPLIPAKAKLYSVGQYDQTLPFYLGRTMTLVGYRGELDFGLAQEPTHGFDDLESFMRDWERQPQAVALMTPELFQQLSTYNGSMRLVAKHRNLVVVTKP